MRTAHRSLVLLSIVALLAAGTGFAQGGVRRAVGADGITPGTRTTLTPGFPAGGIFALPIGTTVTVSFYDEEPDADTEPTTTLAITIGEDSEVTFADAFAAAREEAAFVRFDVAEATRSIELAGDVDATRWIARVSQRPFIGGLDHGDAVTVSFYPDDPATGAEPVASLTFTYGEDSAIGFQAAVRAAAADAAFAVVTTSPRSVTLELAAARPSGAAQIRHAGPHSYGLRGIAPGRPLFPGYRLRR